MVGLRDDLSVIRDMFFGYDFVELELFTVSQPERLSLGILNVANSVFTGPKKPAGRPVDLLSGAILAALTGAGTTPRDLPLVLILGTGILLRLVVTLRFS